MKKNLTLLVITLLGIFSAHAQVTTKYDTIIKYNNDTIVCKISDIIEDGVKFTYPDQHTYNTMYKCQYREIKLANGGILKGSRVEINGADDYKKVTFTTNEDDVKNLKSMGKVSVASSDKVYGAYANTEYMVKTAKTAIQKQAAKKGCHIVLLTSPDSGSTTNSTAANSQTGAQTVLSGIAYTYPE